MDGRQHHASRYGDLTGETRVDDDRTVELVRAHVPRSG